MKRPRPPFVIAGIVGAIVLVAFIKKRDPGFCLAPAPHEVEYVLPSHHPQPDPSEGCRPLEEQTNEVFAGEKRSYELTLPEHYDPKHPYPLVLWFHGNGGSAAGDQTAMPFPSTIAVYPQAVTRRVWADHFAPHWGKVEDLPLFDALVAQIEQRLCVDKARVFAAGWSSGGYFANQLACVRPAVVKAFFAFASGGPEDATCNEPVPGFIHHDRDDHTVFITEGMKSRDNWLATNRCEQRSHEDGGCTVYEGCRAPFAFCETSGNGHGVPPSVMNSARRSIAAF